MRVIEVETKPTGGNDNDCSYCCFALQCVNPCYLPKGKHYEKRPQYDYYGEY